MSMFLEARLKVERAKKHINDLNGVFLGFTNTKTYEVFIERESQGWDDLLKVRAIQTLPPEFALVLGDALHNLRTALDYAANEIEFLHRGQRTGYTKFPIYDTRKSLEDAVNGGFNEKAPKQVIECILDTVQPYEGGDGHGIWALHALDIEDKHRLLVAKTELSFIDGICIEDERGVEVFPGTWLLKDQFIAAFPIAFKNAKVKNQGKASFRIVFADSLPLANKEIIPVLHRLTELVISVLDEVQRSYALSRI
jgi:hypothetical protein